MSDGQERNGELRLVEFGGGVAGLTAAAALHVRGRGCRVYERRPAGGAAGMGIVLSAEAMADLAGAGLDPPGPSPRLDSLGVELHRYRCYDVDGTLQYTEDIPPGWRGVPRSELVEALLHRLPAGTVVHGAGLASLDLDSTGSVVGARLTTGEPVRADLYLAADGAHSLARRALHPDWPERPARVRELVGIVHCPPVRDWAGSDLHKFYTPGAAIGILPVGDGTVGWYMQFDAEQVASPPDTATARREFAYRLVGAWADPIPQLLRATDFTQTHLWHPIDADLVPHFHSDNLALLGDAAHPLLPFTSQGVGAAVAGARDLAARLDQVESVPAALAAYSTACGSRCQRFVEAGRALTRGFVAGGAQTGDMLPLAVPSLTGPRP